MNTFKTIFIGKNNTPFSKKEVEGKFCNVDNENYYMIANMNEMRPFFMSIASNSNHWMFISSNGALTAGRKNADLALFPYYSDDKITESAETTGSKSIFLVSRNHKTYLWTPFSDKYEGIYSISRNIYKNIYGNKIIFEEVNHDLEITFRYQWNSSNKFGFVRKSTLINFSEEEVKISILDGLQNLLPYGVPSDMQNATSNLVDAYKRSELVKKSGLGIYSLSAIIVDKAEPSEALKANIVWSLGLENATHLLSSLQLKNFRKGIELEEETDIKGEKGSYFVSSEITLPAKEEKKWLIIANVNQTHSSIIQLSEQIQTEKTLFQDIQNDINEGTKRLIELVASSDGLQLTDDKLRDARHFSNTMFNIMRGGIFDHNYNIDKQDFIKYLAQANKKTFLSNSQLLEKLPDIFNLSELNKTAEKSNDTDFKRLSTEYLPLMFSRRHGDPSRPWNKFSINTHSEIDGSKVLDYQGNWRDIFQNWEALAISYPNFLEGMIHKFLNSSTFDGYNPYRLTKDGFDWETIEPDNPWSYIGYWGDHQIIYLLKLLEILEKHQPEKLKNNFNEEVFVYANVPYKIKSYDKILKNSKDTIAFDSKLDSKIRQKRETLGADGALIEDTNGNIYKVTFIEKILATVLAKMSNFIPEAGIWMNTQRPEWNDANNALVGNGVSMVTLYYLRRFLSFFNEIITNTENESMLLSEELATCFEKMFGILEQHKQKLNVSINNSDRKTILDGLALSVSNYRTGIYEKSFSGKKKNVPLNNLKNFIQTSLQYLEHTIKANKREDSLYQAYNLMSLDNENEISISNLSEMLEGQVAVLSSGYLTSEEALQLLDSLKQSKLYREDQNSYILYPNKELPHFLEKNNVTEKMVTTSELLKKLISDGNSQIIEKDVIGYYHFNGNFKNSNDLKTALENITGYDELVKKDKKLTLDIFEETFNHKAFTGRSGTFYAYEGLGSIYWHMVSKLLLAVQECCLKAFESNKPKEVTSKLLAHYYEISEGIGIHKSPQLYGAFPTDPYSHTPMGKGAKQPGMTGQVKEDILSRFGELGIFVSKGQVYFNPHLLKKNEFISEATTFSYVDINSTKLKIQLPENSLAFTYCQVPIIYQMAEEEGLEIINKENKTLKASTLILDKAISKQIFERSGEIISIRVNLRKTH